MKYLSVLLLLLTSCASICRGVVGAKYSNRTHEIDYVYSDTGASEMGIKEGDVIVDPELIIGRPGQYSEVTIIRNGKELIFQRVRLVCVSDLYLRW